MSEWLQKANSSASWTLQPDRPVVFRHEIVQQSTSARKRTDMEVGTKTESSQLAEVRTEILVHHITRVEVAFNEPPTEIDLTSAIWHGYALVTNTPQALHHPGIAVSEPHLSRREIFEESIAHAPLMAHTPALQDTVDSNGLCEKREGFNQVFERKINLL